MFKKILFPFFNKERHGFLFTKWYFRTTVVVYSTMLMISPFCIFFGYFSSQTSWCYDSLYLFSGNNKSYDYVLQNCSDLSRHTLFPSLALATIGFLIVHYIIQFIFFKIIVDYIILDSKK